MQEVSVIIPNYNGMAYLEGVLSSLEQQEFQNFETILVDNGSSDGSVAFVMGNFPWVHIVELPDNFGFSRAVNEACNILKPLALRKNIELVVTMATDFEVFADYQKIQQILYNLVSNAIKYCSL